MAGLAAATLLLTPDTLLVLSLAATYAIRLRIASYAITPFIALLRRYIYAIAGHREGLFAITRQRQLRHYGCLR